jgi:hypothetical protein
MTFELKSPKLQFQSGVETCKSIMDENDSFKGEQVEKLFSENTPQYPISGLAVPELFNVLVGAKSFMHKSCTFY